MSTKEINEEHVRETAYHIWNNEGQPEGKAAEHWLRALDELQVKDDEKAAQKAQPQPA
jgi:hypothetical protein